MKKRVDFASISIQELAGLVSEKLREEEIECVLVGGACVSIYSKNQYQSYDLDFILYEDTKKVGGILKKLGFKPEGRYFVHPDCPFFIEFVSPPIAIGNQPVEDLNSLQTGFGEIHLLSVEDCICDRLAGYFYWNDQQSLQQAVDVIEQYRRKIDKNKIHEWARKEGKSKELQRILSEGLLPL